MKIRQSIGEKAANLQMICLKNGKQSTLKEIF
jgi:hypothetical protein